MIKDFGGPTKRQYDILIACALKSKGFKGDSSTAAAFINQIDYWIEKFKELESNKADNQKKHYKNGTWWVYNTYSDWSLQFPNIDEKTIKRIVRELEKIGIVRTGRYNEKGYDRTKWYSLNYKMLESLMQQERDKLSLCNNPYLSLSNGTDLPEQYQRILKEYIKAYS